jgi:enamine deaminase RidA (YjgF/YER057c/UK114 family)
VSAPRPVRGDRQRIGSGGPWEAKVGYSRAVRVGRMVFVAGTTAARPDGTIAAPGDLYGQANAALDTIEGALRAAGASRADVVRVRYFVTDLARFEELSRAHRERFLPVRPAATAVEVRRLLAPEMLVEVEVDAVRALSRKRPRPRGRSARARRRPS